MAGTLPSSAGGAGSTPDREAGIPHALRPRNQNKKQKQCCHKFNKDFNKMIHIKKKSFKNK